VLEWLAGLMDQPWAEEAWLTRHAVIYIHDRPTGQATAAMVMTTGTRSSTIAEGPRDAQ